MTVLESVFFGLGSLSGASSVAMGLVFVACRHEPWICFLALNCMITTATVASLCFHVGGLF
jgi:hypothetical protein